jgi:hypothetical protein
MKMLADHSRKYKRRERLGRNRKSVLRVKENSILPELARVKENSILPEPVRS